MYPKCHYHFYACLCTLVTLVGICNQVLEWSEWMNTLSQRMYIWYSKSSPKDILDLHKYTTNLLKFSSSQLNFGRQVICQSCHDIRISIRSKVRVYKLACIIKEMSYACMQDLCLKCRWWCIYRLMQNPYVQTNKSKCKAEM